MSINCLPPECLLVIFDYVDQMDALRNCSKVCLKWASLITDRCSKVEYLLEYTSDLYQDKTVYIGSKPNLEKYELTELFPKLKIVDASFTDLAHWEECAKSIKGLIFQNKDKSLIKPLYLKNIEMLSSEYVEFFFHNQHLLWKLKQVAIQSADLSIMRGLFSKLPSLWRLQIVDKNCYQKLYKGAKLKRLKILEYDFDSLAGVLVYPGFCFIDYCPFVESAFFNCEATYCRYDFTNKNPYLQNLVIEYQNDYPMTYSPFFRYGGRSQRWDPDLKLILSKFPNLRNLALRNNLVIQDEHIEELIQMLPKLELLDVRGSKEITYKSLEYINRYCQRNKKQIEFYFDTNTDLQHSYPEISYKPEVICRGFDFMKNCFFKSFRALPLLMDSKKD